jgi:hypothetical protein
MKRIFRREMISWNKRGVSPKYVSAFTQEPLFTSVFTMSSVPSLQATCKGVPLFDILILSIFAPCEINKETTSG